MGNTLYIHIGNHKTGTTSIQHTLAHHTSLMARQGMVFFRDNMGDGAPGFPDIHTWLNFVDPERVIPNGMTLAAPERLAETLAGFDSDVIISSENFSFFFRPEHVQLVKDHLAPAFEQVRIICYIRRQDGQASSHKQEGSKLARHAEYDLWGNSMAPLPPYRPELDLYLDYNARLDLWADVFGEDAINIRVFEPDHMLNGDVTEDFFDLLGVEITKGVFRQNQSRGPVQTALGHVIAGSEFRRKPLLQSIVNRLDLPATPILPLRSEAEAFYDHYRDSNIALNARFGIVPGQEDPFNTDFSHYPETREAQWSEDDMRAVFAALLREIERRA